MGYSELDRNLGIVFTAVDIVVFTLSSITVLLRLGTRVWITRNFGLDDATIALAQAITAVGKGFVVTEVSYGLGQHRSRLSDGQYGNYLKYDFLDWAQFFVALLVTKISICLFLLRLSQFNRLRAVLYGLIGFLFTTHIPLILMYVLQCDPIRKAWDRGVPGKCWSRNLVENVVIAQGVFSFLTDFACAAFPAMLLWNVKIKLRTKFGVYFLMSAGVITAAIAIARTAFSWQIKSDDLSWVGIPGALTRVFEVNIGVIAACAPVMRPFVRYVKARVTGKDPHEILRRQHITTQSFHSSWFSRFWSSNSIPKRTSFGQGTNSDRNFQKAPNGKPSNTGNTDVTISLPLQGVSESIDEEILPVRELCLQKSSQSLQTQLGDFRNIREQV
ncbi:hypothetical protein G7Y79_00018g045370 [Physcia stellaris]|nr:hypothetical protein G7Y79_00018g045370 [Physcia stellaris]